MFLFDKSRHGRQSFKSTDSQPKVKWKTDLRTNPPYGAESTAVIDEDGNLYFGSHSGNFYSLSKIGEIRWVFTTKEKIYSSPLLKNDSVIFAGGDGFLYCFSLSGDIKWKFDLAKQAGKMFRKKTLERWLHIPFTYDFEKKKNITFKCWSSPNIIDDKIYISGYGKGLYCIDLEGREIWSHDLGFPRYQLSGVAINEQNTIFLGSRSGKSYAFTPDGKKLWEIGVRKNWEPWGNPVVCNLKQRVYFFFSKRESSGVIVCTDFAGNQVWELGIGSIRGSCCVSHDGESIFCCDLDGFLYRIDTNSGKILKKNKITTTKRGLWITPSLDSAGDILLSTKDSPNKGRVIKFDRSLNIIWEFSTNKVLSVPIVLKSGEILFGSWDGYYYCIG